MEEQQKEQKENERPIRMIIRMIMKRIKNQWDGLANSQKKIRTAQNLVDNGSFFEKEGWGR